MTLTILYNNEVLAYTDDIQFALEFEKEDDVRLVWTCDR